MRDNFMDMTYSCLCILRSGCEEEIVNQSGYCIKKIGMTRIRALELIKIELETIQKYIDLKASQEEGESSSDPQNSFISNILRKQLISGILSVLETYPFCSVANQQCILILDFLKKLMDPSDIHLIKQFVMT